jgi:hypothetical protein
MGSSNDHVEVAEMVERRSQPNTHATLIPCREEMAWRT